jgi:hypothetical protein
MPFECPAGFGLFADVLQRIGEVRPSGHGVKFRCLFPDRHKHGDRHWSGYACIGHTGNLIARCHGCGATWGEIVREVGLPSGAWFHHKGKIYESGRATTLITQRMRIMDNPTATYSYRYEDGTLAYQKLRFEAFDKGVRQYKNFKQRRPLPRSLYRAAEIPEDVKESWVWGLAEGEYGRKFDTKYDLYAVTDEHQCSIKMPDTRLVLYRLPELLAANIEAPVFLVEGEKDVETLRNLGFVATCTVSTSVIDPEWLSPLAGRRVVVVADNDCTGRRHAASQAGWLACGGVRSLRVLWPGEGGYDVGDSGDISDWLRDNEHPREALIALCKKFPEYRIY